HAVVLHEHCAHYTSERLVQRLTAHLSRELVEFLTRKLDRYRSSRHLCARVDGALPDGFFHARSRGGIAYISIARKQIFEPRNGHEAAGLSGGLLESSTGHLDRLWTY